MLHTIESDTLFDVIFIDLWDPGGIPYQYGSRKILTCLDCMPGFGLGAASGLNQITSNQVTGCAFGNFFFTFGITKMIVVYGDGIFMG